MKKEEKVFWLVLVAASFDVLAVLVCPVLISERSWLDLVLGVVLLLAAAYLNYRVLLKINLIVKG